MSEPLSFEERFERFFFDPADELHEFYQIFVLLLYFLCLVGTFILVNSPPPGDHLHLFTGIWAIFACVSGTVLLVRYSSETDRGEQPWLGGLEIAYGTVSLASIPLAILFHHAWFPVAWMFPLIFLRSWRRHHTGQEKSRLPWMLLFALFYAAVFANSTYWYNPVGASSLILLALLSGLYTVGSILVGVVETFKRLTASSAPLRERELPGTLIGEDDAEMNALLEALGEASSNPCADDLAHAFFELLEEMRRAEAPVEAGTLVEWRQRWGSRLVRLILMLPPEPFRKHLEDWDVSAPFVKDLLREHYEGSFDLPGPWFDLLSRIHVMNTTEKKPSSDSVSPTLPPA